MKGIEEGTYKFTYNEPVIQPHELMGHIKKGDITLEECWNTVDDGVFRKIRHGQSDERTPPKRQQKPKN